MALEKWTNRKRVAKPLSFEEVQAGELAFIGRRRHEADFRDDPAPAAPVNAAPCASSGAASGDNGPPTVGLALSGGGIRSASVSLGFVQGLRKYGLFRYFDYLSVISGGSYTGALIASSFYRATGEKIDRSGQTDKRLDIDLIDETVQPERVKALMNDGRYLMRPLEWANRFFSGWFALLLVLASALIAASAMIAFLWRSMDFYVVRDYLNALGIQSDLSSALFPVLLLFVLWGACWVWSFITSGASARGRLAKKVLIALILCAIATISGLIGNGDIEFAGGVTKTANFLKYPLIATILGGLIPIFFRDRLFRSGRIESTFLEKLVYRYTAIAVVVGIPILLIGFFARENVSGYSELRDGRLLWGDVKDFSAFYGWLEKIHHIPADASATPANIGREKPPRLANSLEDEEVVPLMASLLTEIRLLEQIQGELSERIAGSTNWRSPLRTPSTVLGIDGKGVDGSTEAVIRTHDEPLRSGPDPLYVFTRDDDGKLAEQFVLPYTPVLTDQTTWADWIVWKYMGGVRRVGMLLGHLFRHDEDDPLGLALATERRIRDRRTKLLTVFNEVDLASPDFTTKLRGPDETKLRVPDEIKLDALPADLRARVEEYRTRTDWDQLKGFLPDDLLEFNRTMLEATYPDLIRRRSEIRRVNVIYADQMHRFLMFLLFGAIFLVSAFVINPNTTSIQRYYQERLAGAYLGGSDEGHNMRLTDLAPRLGPGPLLLIGGAANYRFRPADKDTHPDALGDSQPVELTERVGQFEFSPLHCGARTLSYMRTDSYCGGALRLADAVAISGAALNPLYFDRWEMLVIFGLLNLRLGQWLPNPSCGRVMTRPTFAALFQDVFKIRQWRTTWATERRHVLLTDGGHFDNTGLQSLLERRCKIIVMCDASHDAEFVFDDLAVVIGRMKGRQGTTFREIGSTHELDLCAHAAAMRDRKAHFFCCEINYGRRGEDVPPSPDGAKVNGGERRRAKAETGLLIYFKSSLTGDEPPFVWNHAAKCAAFPHDPTFNQSFGPEQFCAYLGLGQHFVESMVKGRRRTVQDVGKSLEYQLRDFAELFLGDVDDVRRHRFLEKLLPGAGNDEQDRALLFDEVTARFQERLQARDWDRLAKVVAQLRQCLTPEQERPAMDPESALDLLASAVIALDDRTEQKAHDLLEEVASLFWKPLVMCCERETKPDTFRAIASEIQERFQAVKAARGVRPVLRHAAKWCTCDLIEHLLREGDAIQDAFIAETMNELGELVLRERVGRSKRLRKIVALKKFSSSREVRGCADRLLCILDNSPAHRAREEKSAEK